MLLILFLHTFPFPVHAEKVNKKKAKKLEHGARVAILPFENMSGHFLDIDNIMKPLHQNFRKIFSLSYTDKVDEVIWQLRLRNTGYLSSRDALEIGQRLGVEAVILGMICLYRETPEPDMGLIIKVIGTGGDTPILWSDCINRSGDQTKSLFGINRINKIDSLFEMVARELVEEIYVDLIRKKDDSE
ncbi:MAG: hypothetical protein ACMUIU_02240 [bacterium]